MAILKWDEDNWGAEWTPGSGEVAATVSSEPLMTMTVNGTEIEVIRAADAGKVPSSGVKIANSGTTDVN